MPQSGQSERYNHRWTVSLAARMRSVLFPAGHLADGGNGPNRGDLAWGNSNTTSRGTASQREYPGPNLRPAQRRPRHRRTTPLLRPLRARARTWPPFDWASIHRWPAMIPAARRILRGRSQGIGLAQACCDDAAFGTVAPVSVCARGGVGSGQLADCGTTRRAALWYTDPECGGTCSHVCGAAWPRQNSLGFAL